MNVDQLWQMRIIRIVVFVAASCRQTYSCRPVACIDTTHVLRWTLGKAERRS